MDRRGSAKVSARCFKLQTFGKRGSPTLASSGVRPLRRANRIDTVIRVLEHFAIGSLSRLFEIVRPHDILFIIGSNAPIAHLEKHVCATHLLPFII